MRSRFKRFTCLLVVILISMSMMVGANAEGTEGIEEPFLTSRKDVVSDSSTFFPNNNIFPFNDDQVTSIGFDSLYGKSRSLVRYKGEIPYQMRDQFPFRYYPGVNIGDLTRPWSSLDSVDVNDQSKDPHIWAMTQKQNDVALFFGNAGLKVVNGLHAVVNMLLNCVTMMKSIDFAGLINLFDNGGVAKTLSQLFLIDIDNGTLSPFMVLALLLYLVCLVKLVFGMIKGNGTLKSILGEFSILVGSLLITSVFFLPGNITKLANIGLDFTTALANEMMVASIGDEARVYMYEGSTSSGQANHATQMGLINKMYIDAVIEAQFGYPVSELFLVNPDGGEGNFGDLSTLDTVMNQTFGNDADRNAMEVVTSSASGENKINNLGYYMWAANSSTAISNGSNNIWHITGENIETDRDSNQRVLYVIDFLSNLRNAYADDSDMVNKIDNIVYNIVNPDYGGAVNNVTLVCLTKLCMVIGLFWIALFTMIGQLIIVLGAFFLVTMPALMLFPGTRDLARRMAWTYLIAFMRFLIGSALFNALIVIAVLLSDQGSSGMIVAMVTCLLMARFGPLVISEVNMWISRSVGGRELPIVNRAFMRVGRHGKSSKMFDKIRSRFKKPSSGLNASTGGGGGSQSSGSGNDASGGNAPQQGSQNNSNNTGWNSAFGEKKQTAPEVDNEDESGKSVVGSQAETDGNEDDVGAGAVAADIGRDNDSGNDSMDVEGLGLGAVNVQRDDLADNETEDGRSVGQGAGIKSVEPKDGDESASSADIGKISDDKPGKLDDQSVGSAIPIAPPIIPNINGEVKIAQGDDGARRSDMTHDKQRVSDEPFIIAGEEPDKVDSGHALTDHKIEKHEAVAHEQDVKQVELKHEEKVVEVPLVHKEQKIVEVPVGKNANKTPVSKDVDSSVKTKEAQHVDESPDNHVVTSTIKQEGKSKHKVDHRGVVQDSKAHNDGDAVKEVPIEHKEQDIKEIPLKPAGKEKRERKASQPAKQTVQREVKQPEPVVDKEPKKEAVSVDKGKDEETVLKEVDLKKSGKPKRGLKLGHKPKDGKDDGQNNDAPDIQQFNNEHIDAENEE